MAISLDIPNIVYQGQGKCLICLRTFSPGDTGREAPSLEHVIPEALCKTGQIVISNGTCVGCNNDANKRYEQTAIHADFNTPRILFGLKRKKRPSAKRKVLKLPPIALGDATQGGSFDVELSVDDYPNRVSLLMFEPAGKLLGIDRGNILSSIRPSTFYIGAKQRITTNITTQMTFDHTALSLTIAKIAYCHAAARLGLEAFDGNEIRALLREERNDIYNFVGGVFAKQHLTTRHLHKLYIKNRGDILTVIVHLFASCGMAPYEVVVGKIIEK
jgi:hypothetical protein